MPILQRHNPIEWVHDLFQPVGNIELAEVQSHRVDKWYFYCHIWQLMPLIYMQNGNRWGGVTRQWQPVGGSHTCRRTRKPLKRPSGSTFWLILEYFRLILASKTRTCGGHLKFLSTHSFLCSTPSASTFVRNNDYFCSTN